MPSFLEQIHALISTATSSQLDNIESLIKSRRRELELVNVLPMHIIALICRYLARQDLNQCLRTSKDWNIVFSQDQVWEHLLKSKRTKVPTKQQVERFYKIQSKCKNLDSICCRQISSDYQNKITCFAIDSANRIAVAFSDRSIKVYTCQSSNWILYRQIAASVASCIAWQHDVLIIGCFDCSLCIVDSHTLVGHTNVPNEIVVLSSERAVSRDSHNVILWDILNGIKLACFKCQATSFLLSGNVLFVTDPQKLYQFRSFISQKRQLLPDQVQVLESRALGLLEFQNEIFILLYQEDPLMTALCLLNRYRRLVFRLDSSVSEFVDLSMTFYGVLFVTFKTFCLIFDLVEWKVARVYDFPHSIKCSDRFIVKGNRDKLLVFDLDKNI